MPLEKHNRELIAGFVAASAALVLFGWLADAVLRGATLRMDTSIRNAVHARATPGLTALMSFITQLGAPSVVIGFGVLLVLWLVAQHRGRAAVIFAVAALGAEALDQILKFVFQRPRPAAFFGFPQPLGYSFPSGHSVMAACFYGVAAAILTVRMRSRAARLVTWTLAAVLALIIGLSRIYLGVHYPSDVLAGYAAAIIWVAAVRAAYAIWFQRRDMPGPVEER